MSYTEDKDQLVIDYEAALKDNDDSTEEIANTIQVPKGVKELRKALCLGSAKEWQDWLKSGFVRPHWVELWDSVIKNATGPERGVGLHIVQRRLANGEANGARRFSSNLRSRDDFDTIDHYARFLYWVKSENLVDREGVFYNRNLSDSMMDAIIWSLKEVLRQMHSPSQIDTPSGGTAIFGLTRDSTSTVEGNKRKQGMPDHEQEHSKRQKPHSDEHGHTSKGSETEEVFKHGEPDDITKHSEGELGQQVQSDDNQPWVEEIMHPHEQFALTRKSPTYKESEKYWQYTKCLEAMNRVRRLPTEAGDVVDLSDTANAESAMNDTIEANSGSARSRSRLPRLDADLKNNIFDAQQYESAQDFVNGLGAELNTNDRSAVMQPTMEGLERYNLQRQWLDNLQYQRDNVEEACAKLNIESPSYPRLQSMVRSATLKFWQPPAIWRLREIAQTGYLRGACLGDSMGLGKTWETIAFILKAWEEYNDQVKNCKTQGKPVPNGKPFLAVVPPNLVDQWFNEIRSVTKRLSVYLYYGDQRKHSATSSYFISDKLTPSHFLFDGKPKNGRAIILTSYQTLAARHGPAAVKAWCETEKMPFDAGHPQMPANFPYRLTGCFGTTVFDEAHSLRNPESNLSLTAHWLESDFNLLISGTLFYSGISDMKGYAPLLFKTASWSMESIHGHGLDGAAGLFSIAVGHPLEPMLCTADALNFALDKENTPEQSGALIRRILSLLLVRRTLSSQIPFQSGNSIGNNIPPSQTKVLRLELEEHEQDPYDAFHMKNKRHLFIRDSNHPNRFIWNYMKLRRLVLASSWLGFIFLEGSLHSNNITGALKLLCRNKLINMWKSTIKDQTPIDKEAAQDFYRTTIDHTDSRYTENLELLLRGSPKLRKMLPILMDQVLVHGEKSCIWVMFPAEQVYLAAALHEVGIDFGVLHGGLDPADRAEMITAFTTRATDCMVLLCSYSVDSSGLNLQAFCRNVHLFSPPTSRSVIEQAIGRVQRIGQTRVVLVYEYRVSGTFNAYMVNRNKSRAIPGIVTELSPDMALSVGQEQQTSLDMDRWVLRAGVLTHLGSAGDQQPGDVTQHEKIMDALLTSLEGLTEY